MGYEICFTCKYFKSDPERCICIDHKNLCKIAQMCKMEEIDELYIKKKSIVKRVKLLCDILEIDHLGLVSEGLKRLQDEYNKYVVRESNFTISQKDVKTILDYWKISIVAGERMCDLTDRLKKEIEPTEIELLKDQENHEILEAEIKAEREREGG